MMMQMYAIRHNPTGHYLGDPKGRGGSHMEPEPPTEIRPPRLFHTEHAAKTALGHWLRGKVTVGRHRDYYGEADEHWHLEPVESRKRAEMSVVPVSLVLP